MKLDDWKARLRAPSVALNAFERPLKPVVVVDGPPIGPPLMLLIKPISLLSEPGRSASFQEFVALADHEAKMFSQLGHDQPMIRIESDRNVLSDSVSLRFSLTGEGRNTMVLPAKFRQRNDATGRGDLPTIELLVRRYRAPRFLGLLRESTEVIKDDILAAWAREDSIQFGAWPEDSKLSHKRTIIGLECLIESPDGARAAFTIRVDGEALSVPLPPFLGATLNLDETVFHGR